MKKKIIYVSILPLDKNNYERFGIENFFERGWDVEYWIFMNKNSSFFQGKNLFYKKEKNFLIFESIFQMIKKIKNLESKNFYFISIGQPWYVEKIISIKGGKKIVLDIFQFPEVYNVTIKKFFLRKFSFNSFFYLLIKLPNIIVKKIINKLLKDEPFYVFTAGYISEKIASSYSKKTKIIKSHSLDYDRYLKLKKEPLSKNLENSIVYIDQCYEDNYGKLLEGETNLISRELHWKLMKKFLNKLSLKLNKKVIIAAHPKRDQNDQKDIEYEIIYDQTSNLIKNASLVVGHNSTAVSLVTLFEKPYVCVTADELMKDDYFYFSIKKFSKELGSVLINIDHFKDYNSYNFLKYDKDIYKTYIKNYVKTPDVESEDFWSDFIDFFENENESCR